MNKKQALKFGLWIALGLGIVLFAALAIYFYLSYKDTKYALEQNLTYYQNKTLYLESENEWLKQELNKSVARLNNLSYRLAQLEQNLTNLTYLYNECISRPPEVVERVEIVNPLNFSEWFKGMNWTNDYLFSELTRECSTLGELSFPCVVYLLQKRGYLLYVTEGPDPFLNVQQALTQGKGDCEEFAVVEWAYLNKYKELLPDRRLELMAKAGFNEPGMSYVIYSSGEETLKLSGYKPYLMGPVGQYYYGVACYNINETIGHCGVVISLKPLNNVSDFLGAKLVDSQTGELLGTIGEDFQLCKRSPCGPNEIWVVLYDETLARWENNTWRYN